MLDKARGPVFGSVAGMSLADWMHSVLGRVERELDAVLPAEDVAPRRLHAAMRYAVLQGGKRVRPLLAFAAGEITGADAGRVVRAAAAVEMIHAYSLVHDDLPCMDDDILRRGKPTVHVQFDEATALLAGDALQSLAFSALAHGPGDAAQTVLMLQGLADASGSRGMAGGQAIDLASVGVRISVEELEAMHSAKTGALLRAAVMLGALSGRALRRDEQVALETYCAAVGLAFQVVDDVLDVETDTATLGKTAGKDAEQNKPTYVSLLGLEASRTLAEKLRGDAHAALEGFGPAALRLHELADFIVLRKF